ncbi:MAG: hypothetical protein WC712_02815 [Candidatus Brocadiia bacterium]
MAKEPSGVVSVSLILRIAFIVLAAAFAVCAALNVGTGKPKFEPVLKVKPKVMSALYKVYANAAFDDGAMWVAKAIIKNEGTSPIRNLKLSYRIPTIVEWSTPETYDVVYPGQTVVSAYYPVLPDSLAKLKSPRTVNLEFKYSQLGAGGDEEEIMQQPLELLSVHEIMYSRLLKEESTGSWFDAFESSHLASAWVTPSDPVIISFAGKANVVGVGANTGQQNQLLVMEQIWEMYRVNDILYMSPANALSPEASFVGQSLKFPREVIEARQGTCIELALLYASTLEAAGIESMLVMLPGHCFPMGIMKEGGAYVPLETTCLREGSKKQKSFKDAVAEGQKEMAELQKSGQFILVKPRVNWTKGCTAPELPELPADILEKWNVKSLKDAVGNRPDIGTPNQPNANAPKAQVGTYTSPTGMFSIDVPKNWTTDTTPVGVGEKEYFKCAGTNNTEAEVTYFASIGALGARDLPSFVIVCKGFVSAIGGTILGEQQGSVGTTPTWAIVTSWDQDGVDMVTVLHCVVKGSRGYVVAFTCKKANVQAENETFAKINQSIVLK